MNHWVELDKRYFMDTGHRRLEVTLVRGEGARVWDDAGREYLDFIAGWAACSLGHCHPVIQEVIREQASRLILASLDVYTTPQIELAELLLSTSGLAKIFICNSGAEANEGAVKLARKYGKLHLSGAYEVISALKSFHGRTLAMVAATGKPEYQAPFTPLPEGFTNVPYNDIAALRAAVRERTCAILLEPIQGEGGVRIPSEHYLQEVRALCDERGILLILDEVQTGCGRTGTLWAHEYSGIRPDIMTVGKGLGGGVPIAAFLANERAACFGPGDHGSTYGGNPLCSAVAAAVLRFILKEDLVGHAARVGGDFRERLLALRGKWDIVKEVRGRGLLLAVEFTRPVALAMAQACCERGLLVNPIPPQTIRFMPPLIIGRSEVDQAMVILEGAINQMAQVAASSEGAR
ncbi:acetylornithine aminotransferase [Candidatus Methylomirabilis lanthanidiphila]|uniref:Acetylornithine aminotransferase n=1 Tax=Candidatus Methylomirabilis lanthanidiphila TaxID=2211376 RepID=A0A564ZHC7_9BACT|nr:aspartate aminotransferase family protein [Candidatus Methylomirabilis lanthanidiphila]VUZ84526.1 acetylornithine aminotransferase [Candidatus Methylomirabilis lanthanidiphila]